MKHRTTARARRAEMTGSKRTGRRGLLRLLPAIPVLGLAGCFGGAGVPRTWWELVDAGAAEAGRADPDPSRARRSLMVEGLAAGSLVDGSALLYSRNPGMRAPYQYANWTERPAGRLARLARSRLQARGGFRDVSLSDSGVAPDLLLTLTLESLYHELAPDPESLAKAGSRSGNPASGNRPGAAEGLFRLEVSAQLVDWRARQPLASRAFALSEPVAGADAAGAVQAAGRAAAALLDALAPWVEASAAGFSRAPRAATVR